MDSMIPTDRNRSASGLKSAGYKLNPLSSVMLTAPVASVLSLGADNGKYLECLTHFCAFLETWRFVGPILYPLFGSLLIRGIRFQCGSRSCNPHKDPQESARMIFIMKNAVPPQPSKT